MTFCIYIPPDQPDWLWFSVGVLYGIPIGIAIFCFWMVFWRQR